MKSILMRLLATLLSLALLAPIGAPAQGIDPAARGLAAQAKASLGGRTLLGEKFRRLAAAAQLSQNPNQVTPYIVPTAWTAGEVIAIPGTVRSNAGNWYVSWNAGTCGSTAPTNTVSGSPLSDGAVYWEYIGGAISTASMADAPTVTQSTTNPIGSLPQYLNLVNHLQFFKVTGGFVNTAEDSTVARMQTLHDTATTLRGNHIGVTFETDAPKVAFFQQTASTPIRIEVDGRWVNASSYPASASAKQFTTVDFSATTGRKRRRWTIYGGQAAFAFGGVMVSAVDQVFVPSPLDSVRVVAIEDSIGEGTSYGPLRSGDSAIRQTGRLLGWDDVWNFSLGGTGYLNPGTGPYYTFRQRIPEAATLAPDAWLLGGSVNDRAYLTSAPGTLQTEVAATIKAIRAVSAAPIFVVGVWPINDAAYAAGSKNADIEAAVQAGIAAAQQTGVYFIPLTGTVPPAVTGSWNNSFNTTAVNGPLMINTTDSIHPTDLGVRQKAQRIADQIKTLLSKQVP